MKLVTFTHEGTTRTGALLDDGSVLDLHAADAAIPDEMVALLDGGASAMDRVRAAVASGGRGLPGNDVTIEAPLRPRKSLAIGLNYKDHAAETGQELPLKPIVFYKVNTCIVGPGTPVEKPLASDF